MDAGPVRDLGPNANVLRQIEEAEAREVRNARLTREVQEFFEEATRTAANIVSQVAETAEQQQQSQVAREMSEFLTSTIQRAQEFVQIMQSQGIEVSHEDLEPHVRNLVGQKLDAFRWEGTAQVTDQHIGLDPFGVDLELDLADDSIGAEEAVAPQGRAEPRSARPAADSSPARDREGHDSGFDPVPLEVEVVGDDGAKSDVDVSELPVEGHLVAEALGIEPDDDDEPEPFGAEDPMLAGFEVPAVVQWFDRVAESPEQLKTVLKVLVHYDAMTREEAREVFQEITAPR